MRRRSHPLVMALTLGTVVACGPGAQEGDGSGSGSGSGGTSVADSGESVDETGLGEGMCRPYRDEWRVEADLDFVHLGPDGAPQILEVVIGGQETNDNFANRGDVIVEFDGTADRMLIELRRFTCAASQPDAEIDYGNLSLWAYDAPLDRPENLDPQDECVASGWRDGCQVRVYYDGESQPVRSGADIRVTLPPDYRHGLSVVTRDNDDNPDYSNRGNVCIGGLFASAEVDTESGNVWVSLAPDVNPVPRCTLAQIDACENWEVDDGMGGSVPAPWAPECPCITQGGGQFGLLSIDSEISDVTVDMPAGLWASITAENEAPSQNAGGDHCEAMVTVPGAVPNEAGNDFPWQARYSANYPGQPAIMGAGYTIQASSSSCGPVTATEEPEDFVGPGNGAMQASAERGNLEVCSGCIAQSCNELIP